MGTRALISINGKPFIATHWDGYLEGLGKELLESDKSIESIIKIAKSHSIDCADKSILENINNFRLEELCKKHNLTIDKIKEGTRKGNIIWHDDYEISDIECYGDWAEYEYNIENEKVYVRKLVGGYPESLEGSSDYILLTENLINNPEILLENEKYKEYREMQLEKVNKRFEEYQKEANIKNVDI